MYKLIYHKKTILDKRKLKASNLLQKTHKLCELLVIDPSPANSKELYRDLKGKRSVRINLQHRLVYEVFEKEKLIKILSMWGHYSD